MESGRHELALRRDGAGDRFSFGSFELDRSDRQLRRNGIPVHLPPTAYRLLLVLLVHHGRALSYRELIEEIWPGVHVSGAALRTAVRRLRGAMRDAGEPESPIETVRGYGLRLRADLEQAPRTTNRFRLSTADRSSFVTEANRLLIGVEDSSEELLEHYASLTEEGIWCFQLDPPIPYDVGEERGVELAFERARIVLCNAVTASTYGDLVAEDLLGKPVTDFVSPDIPSNAEYFRAVIRSDLNLRGALSREITAAGEPRWIRNNVVGVVSRGRVERLWGTQRDVTAWVEVVGPGRSSLPDGPSSRRQELEQLLSSLRRYADRALRLLDD